MEHTINNPIEVPRRAAPFFRAGLLLFAAALTLGSRAGEKLVNVSNEKIDGATRFYVQNLQSGDVTITLEAKLTNFSSAKPLPCTITIPAHSKVEAFSIVPVDADADASWSYKYFATWGALEVKHDDTFVYSLPYAPGESFPVSQGYHGKYSHTGGDCYAIDFKMPEGSPVHAARGGVVVGVKDDSAVGGPNKKFEWDANYIHIRHSDGTLGQYVHLQKSTARVKVGDSVKEGDWIGCSGNTGHTTGPHLHFAVFKAKDGKSRETFPIRFKAGDGLLALTLKEGSSYKAH